MIRNSRSAKAESSKKLKSFENKLDQQQKSLRSSNHEKTFKVVREGKHSTISNHYKRLIGPQAFYLITQRFASVLLGTIKLLRTAEMWEAMRYGQYMRLLFSKQCLMRLFVRFY